MTSTTMDFWLSLEYQVCVPFCGAGLKSNYRAIGYSHNIHTTIASVSIPCQASCYCGSWGSQQGKAVDDFSPWFCEKTFLHYEN